MSVDCKEIQKMIVPFDNRQLACKHLRMFLKHIDECPDCREELEIYYIVDYGLNEDECVNVKEREYKELLDKFDFKGLVDLKLANEHRKLEKISAINRIVFAGVVFSNMAMIAVVVLFLFFIRS